MATILEFKLRKKSSSTTRRGDTLVTSSVDDMMLIIHHALHGAEQYCRPKDPQLAVKLLDELSSHIKNALEEEPLVLSPAVSQAVLERYPEMSKQQGGQKN